MKKLYVSDLDGTLFNSKKEISQYSADIINKFIGDGGLFSVATARMAYGCEEKLRVLNLNIPIILMNGVCLYLLNEKVYVSVKTIDYSKILQIEEVLNDYNVGGFMYTFRNNKLSIYYKNSEDLKYTQYYSEKAIEECDEIRKVDSFAESAGDKLVIYFALTGDKDQISSIWGDIDSISEINTAMYLNIYNGLYCLEIFDGKGRKDLALKELQNRINAHEIIVFGDNHNDVSMIKIADKSLAPLNAVAEVKDIVDEIIESCDNDGVAKYIRNESGY
jgi:5-amino-6-(5-phospho-D-ribitylamino)uracil phosphatase